MGTRRALIAIAALSALHLNAYAAPSAEALYNEGQTAYSHGDYARAIAKWERSYQLSDQPALLFNIAQANRLAGNCERALSAYRRFLELDSRAKERSLAEQFLVELEPTCGASSRATSEPEREAPANNLKLYGLVTGGAGAALLVTGLAFGAHASSLGDQVTDTCKAGCDWNDAGLRSKDAAGRRDTTIGYTLDVLGLAGLAGGAVMYYLGSRDHTVTVTPRGHGDGAVLMWSGSW